MLTVRLQVLKETSATFPPSLHNRDITTLPHSVPLLQPTSIVQAQITQYINKSAIDHDGSLFLFGSQRGGFEDSPMLSARQQISALGSSKQHTHHDREAKECFPTIAPVSHWRSQNLEIEVKG